MSKIIRASIILNDADAPSPTSGRLVIESIGTEALAVTGIAAYGFTFAQTAATIPAGQGTSINFFTNAYVGGTRVVTITSDKTSGDNQPQITIARTTDNAIVIPTEDAAMEPTIHDFNNEVDALMRPTYPPNQVIKVLSRKIEGSGGDADYTAYLAALDQAEIDAAANLGYYPLTATPAAGDVIAAGATKEITVAAAGDYVVTCPAGCTSDITNGTPSDTTVTITVAANTGIERTFGVQFATGNMAIVTASITQLAAADAVTVSPATDTALAAGEAIAITVSAISPVGTFCTAACNVAGVTLSKVANITNEAITATLPANTGAERVATVTVTSGTATDTCVITQAAAGDYVPTNVSPDVVDFDGLLYDAGAGGDADHYDYPCTTVEDPPKANLIYVLDTTAFNSTHAATLSAIGWYQGAASSIADVDKISGVYKSV
jgi:hypothetical protein